MADNSLPRYQDRSVGVPTFSGQEVNIKNYMAEDLKHVAQAMQNVGQDAVNAHVKLRNLSELNEANTAADKLQEETQTKLRNLEKGTPEEKAKAHAEFVEWYKTAHSEAAKNMNGRTSAIFKQKTRELGFAGDKESYMIQSRHQVSTMEAGMASTTDAAHSTAQRAPEIAFSSFQYLQAQQRINEGLQSGSISPAEHQKRMAALNEGTALNSMRSFIAKAPEKHQEWSEGKGEPEAWWVQARDHLGGNKMNDMDAAADREIKRRQAADVTRENREDTQHEKRRKKHIDAVILEQAKEASKPGANIEELKMRLYDNAEGSMTGTVDADDPKKRTMLMTAHELAFAERLIDEHAKEDEGKTDPDVEFKYRDDLTRDKPQFGERQLQADRKAGRLSRTDYRMLSTKYLSSVRAEEREDQREKRRGTASAVTFVRSRFQFVGQDEDFVNETKRIRGGIVRDVEDAIARVPAGPEAAAKIDAIVRNAEEQADRLLAPVIHRETRRLAASTGGYISVRDFDQAVSERKVTRIGGMDMTDGEQVGKMRAKVAQIERLMVDRAAKDLEIKTKKALGSSSSVGGKFGMGLGTLFGGGSGGGSGDKNPNRGGRKREDQE